MDYNFKHTSFCFATKITDPSKARVPKQLSSSSAQVTATILLLPCLHKTEMRNGQHIVDSLAHGAI